MTSTVPQTAVIAARLPSGRFLIAQLDPCIPERQSPLRRALRANRIDIPLAARDGPG